MVSSMPFISMHNAVRQSRMTRAELEAAIESGRLAARMDGGVGRSRRRWMIVRRSLTRLMAARP